MPILLPPKRRRPPSRFPEDGEQDSDAAMKLSIICVLLIANLIVFVSKYTPDDHYAMAAAPSDTIQLSP